MILDEFLTPEITELTDDKAIHTMCLYYRYLMCAYGICRFIVKHDKNENVKNVVRKYIDDFQVATILLGSHLDESFAHDAKLKRRYHIVDEETWCFVSKEVKNYVISNEITRQGIVKQLELAHAYAFQLLKIIIRAEENYSKNLTNLKN